MTRRVIVIGGGVAGLVAAREVALAGGDVIVLEAGGVLGGAVRAGEVAGVTVDLGAEAFGVTRPETGQLIEELGLGDQVIAPRRSDAHLLLADGQYDLPRALLGIPTDLASPEVASIIGPDEVARAQVLDARPLETTGTAGQGGPESLGHLVRQRMGDAVADRILTPVVAGVHAAAPDLVEVEAVIPGLTTALARHGSLARAAAAMRSAAGVPGAAIAGLAGGMSTMVGRLADECRRLGVDIREATAVSGVQQTGRGWEVRAEGRSLSGDGLVMAVDAPAAGALLAPFGDVARALAAITVGDVAVVAVALDAPELDDDPVGSGLLIAPGHPTVRAKALTHASAKWDWVRHAFGPGRHLVRLSYGRDGRIDEPLDELAAIAAEDVGIVFGLDEVRVVDTAMVRWNRSLVFPRTGHRERVAAVASTVAGIGGLAVVGAGLGGNGLAGTIALARTAPQQLGLLA